MNICVLGDENTSSHICELQIEHEALRHAQEGAGVGRAVYARVRIAVELIMHTRGVADCAALVDLVPAGTDLAAVPWRNWFADEIPVGQWEGVVADGAGRIYSAF